MSIRKVIPLIAYSAISLLGHAGMHALPGMGHCSHMGQASRPAEAKSSHHNHLHDHDHCSHDHRVPVEHEAPVEHPFHSHDDDCLVCQWFSHGQAFSVEGIGESRDQCCYFTMREPPHGSLLLPLKDCNPRGPPWT